MFLAKKWRFERILSGETGGVLVTYLLGRSIGGGCRWCLTLGQLYHDGSYFLNEKLLSSLEGEGVVEKDGKRIAHLEQDVWVALDRGMGLT